MDASWIFRKAAQYASDWYILSLVWPNPLSLTTMRGNKPAVTLHSVPTNHINLFLHAALLGSGLLFTRVITPCEPPAPLLGLQSWYVWPPATAFISMKWMQWRTEHLRHICPRWGTLRLLYCAWMCLFSQHSSASYKITTLPGKHSCLPRQTAVFHAVREGCKAVSSWSYSSRNSCTTCLLCSVRL